MNLTDFFKLYKDLIIFTPAKWIWSKIHSFDFLAWLFTDIGCHIISIFLIIFIYSILFYIIWCFVAGILDIFTYNKRRTYEILKHEKDIKDSISAYDKWVLQMREQDTTNPPRLDPNENKELFEGFVAATAENAGISKRKARKYLKKQFNDTNDYKADKNGVIQINSAEDMFKLSLTEQGLSDKEIKKIMKDVK